MYHGQALVASRFVPVSSRFDPVFNIYFLVFSCCASVALDISIAGSFRFAIGVHGSNATVLSRHGKVHHGLPWFIKPG